MGPGQPGDQRTDAMSFEKTPGGTRGTRTPPGGPLMRGMMRAMTGFHKMSGDKFQGMELLYLTTVGAKSGQKRQSTVARFADGEDAWLVVASAGGAAHNPAWYHNIAAHPDQVLDRVRREADTGDPDAARRGRPRAGVAADHPEPAPLPRLRAEDRPRDPGHPAHPRRRLRTPEPRGPRRPGAEQDQRPSLISRPAVSNLDGLYFL